MCTWSPNVTYTNQETVCCHQTPDRGSDTQRHTVQVTLSFGILLQEMQTSKGHTVNGEDQMLDFDSLETAARRNFISWNFCPWRYCRVISIDFKSLQVIIATTVQNRTSPGSLPLSNNFLNFQLLTIIQSEVVVRGPFCSRRNIHSYLHLLWQNQSQRIEFCLGILYSTSTRIILAVARRTLWASTNFWLTIK